MIANELKSFNSALTEPETFQSRSGSKCCIRSFRTHRWWKKHLTLLRLLLVRLLPFLMENRSLFRTSISGTMKALKFARDGWSQQLNPPSLRT